MVALRALDGRRKAQGRKTRNICAEGALGTPAEEGEGWGGVVQTSSCASVWGTLACCCSMCSASEPARTSARRVTGNGVTSPQAGPVPRTLSARARTMRARAVRAW